MDSSVLWFNIVVCKIMFILKKLNYFFLKNEIELIILLKLTNHSDYADQLFRYP